MGIIKKSTLTLTACLTILGSVSCAEPLREGGSSIVTKTWDAGFLSTKASIVDMEWESTDMVTVFSVRDGVVVYRSDVGIEIPSSGKGKDGNEYATITAEVSENADCYYAYYPSTACPLKVGDKYSKKYEEPSWAEAPRLHDLPQYAEVSKSSKSINFYPLTSCFRLYEVRKEKLPIQIKVFCEESLGNGGTYWKALYDGEISDSTVDLDAHFSRKSLFKVTDYYDFCWVLPDDKTFKVKFKYKDGTRTYISDPFTPSAGTVIQKSIWGL